MPTTYSRAAERWLMYLRKSRADNPDESVDEVLSKHETILQEWAQREFGHVIPEENIYREVVSGESIEERVEIKRVLARIEDPAVVGVLVVDPQRLSRGDLEDCGQLINLLRFTHTLVATPMMTYDLENKMERRFFQDELLRGRDYLEYVKEILVRGRVAAVKRGCYIAPRAPLGYDRVKLGRDWTLRPNEDAALVKMIFAWYVEEGMTPRGIAVRLNKLGQLSPNGKQWGRDSVHDILKNIHYTGKVRWNKIRETWVVEDGVRIKKHLRQPTEEVIIAEGKHEAIIDVGVFESAQARLASSPPRTQQNKELVNPLAGLLRCTVCGNVMSYMNLHKQNPRYACRLRPGCCRSVLFTDAVDAVITALETTELPRLQVQLQSGNTAATTAQQQIIERLQAQMEEYRQQEERQYDFLETGKYTQELFDRRNAALREKMDECSASIAKAKTELPKNINYREKIVKLKDAIAALRNPTASAAERNRLLRGAVERIDYIAPPPGSKDKNFSLDILLRL